MQIGFFSYEGRGVRMGDAPPRYEVIDWDIYNTSSLENKVRDALSAIEAIKRQPQLAQTPVWLIGASEGTLLCAETAARNPDQVAGLVLYGVLASNMRENFRFIMSDGAFLVYRQFFDTNNDGQIDRQEFETDARRYRERVLRGAAFDTFDRNADGVFTADEMALVTKLHIDAIDNENFALLQMWANFNAAVAVPNDWFKDHFAHEPIWAFLKELYIPVGCFHGALDRNTPIAAVKQLEVMAKESDKSRMEFQYFDDGDHSLNVIQYSRDGEMPAAQRAIFNFLDRHIPRE